MIRPKWRFKKGCIVKQEKFYGAYDYFRVTYVHTHDDGSQGLDVIGLFDGVSYGLSADITFPSNVKEAFENYNEEILKMGKYKWYRWLLGGVWVFLDDGQGWFKVAKDNETWALTEMKYFVSEDNRYKK